MTLLFSIYLGTAINISFYSSVINIFKNSQGFNPLFALSVPFFLIFAINFILNFFNWRFLLKPIFIFLAVTSTAVAYNMVKYGVVFDTSMVQNIFETNIAEASSYLNPSLIFW
ncbi:MAG: phosphoethanolamine transferase domain-containing protein, partial [Enterovibrio sp.]